MSGPHVLVVASTFPASDHDESPAFVRDLLLAMKRQCPEARFTVLAPQVGATTPRFTRHADYDEYRFAYAWPRALQRVAGRGILPTLRAAPWLLPLVPMLFVAQWFALMGLIRRLRPNLLHAHWFTPQGITVALASTFTGVPWVLTSHANDVRIWDRIPLGRLVVRALLPTATRITAVSRATADRMRLCFSAAEWSVMERRLTIVPMGVDTTFYADAGPPADEIKAQYDLAGRRVVLFLGRLAAKKGVEILLDAFALADLPDATLVIAGDGPLRGALEHRPSGRGDRVVFLGYLTGDRKRDYLRMADVVVVPSIETRSDAEGLPVVLLETLAAGRVIVASTASGAGDVLPAQEGGFLVPHGDVKVLSDALITALRLPEAAAATWSRAARERAKSFDWNMVAERHWEVLRAAL